MKSSQIVMIVLVWLDCSTRPLEEQMDGLLCSEARSEEPKCRDTPRPLGLLASFLLGEIPGSPSELTRLSHRSKAERQEVLSHLQDRTRRRLGDKWLRSGRLIMLVILSCCHVVFYILLYIISAYPMMLSSLTASLWRDSSEDTSQGLHSKAAPFWQALRRALFDSKPSTKTSTVRSGKDANMRVGMTRWLGMTWKQDKDA